MKRNKHQYAYPNNKPSVKLSSRSRIDDTTYIIQESNPNRPEEYVKDRNSKIMNSISAVNNLDLAKKVII